MHLPPPAPPRQSEAGAGAEAELSLVRAMVDGDDAAWREFHHRYSRLVLRCLGRFVSRAAPHLQREDIRDMHATVFFKLASDGCRRLRFFDPARGIRLSTWLTRVVWNCASDYVRALRREPDCIHPADVRVLRSRALSQLELLERKRRYELVAAKMRRFSRRDRLVIDLYLDGLDAGEIAERLAINIKTVHSKRSKIRARLEAMLGGQRLAA